MSVHQYFEFFSQVKFLDKKGKEVSPQVLDTMVKIKPDLIDSLKFSHLSIDIKPFFQDFCQDILENGHPSLTLAGFFQFFQVGVPSNGYQDVSRHSPF